MDLRQAAIHAFMHFYHADKANASIHCAAVRFSPITFRLAEAINDDSPIVGDFDHHVAITDVLGHKGLYEEDKGR